MRRLDGSLLALSLASLAVLSAPAAAGPAPVFEYLSPVPGSQYHRPETNVIFRAGGRVDPASLDGRPLLTVTGDVSGPHGGRLVLSDDGETLLFLPALPFTPGESVRCRLRPGLRTDARGAIPPTSVSFQIAGAARAGLHVPSAEERLGLVPWESAQETGAPRAPAGSGSRSAATDTLPADFPRLTRTVTGDPAPGLLFLCDNRFGYPGWSSYLMIVDDDGDPVFERKLPGQGFDFKQQPDGRLSYYDDSAHRFYCLDASYAVVDSFQCGNGYGTDLHDLQVLPDGHALLFSYDPEPVDMGAVVPGGDPDATVVGLVIQELDRAKNVVFQWRSWDHFEITDAAPDIDLTAPVIDPVHGNAIERDADGNLLLSSRHLDEITKISRRTGRVIWRWGGRHNEFTFVNDPIGFSHQHDIRRLPNGHVTLFDNGYLHEPQFSRAVEYRLDEPGRTATLVWEHRADPGQIAHLMGSVQRLPNGNTLIGWGSSHPALTEVSPDGAKVSELTFDPGIWNYRAFRFEWPSVLRIEAEAAPKALDLRHPPPRVTVTIRSADFDPARIDVSTIRLDGLIAPEGDPLPQAAPAEGARPGLTLRFPGAEVAKRLRPGPNRLPLEGTLTTGAAFRGEVEWRGVPAPGFGPGRRALVVLSTPGALPVRLRVTDGASRRPLVGVYDVRGRTVARWRAAVDAAGTLIWDGRSRGGGVVRSGVYWLRLEGSPDRSGLKIIVLR
jgi:hypothetical protein